MAPMTDYERHVCSAWQDILGTDKKIGMNDNFFGLGGHSLLAMKLAVALGCDVGQIMSNPTVSALVSELEHNTGSAAYMDGLITSLPESSELTRHEQRMLFIHLSNRDSNSYNMPFCIKFVDEDINICANLALVLESLPILRTRFVDGKAISDASVVVREDLHENSDAIDVWAPFDLERGPLCRFAVDAEKNILKGCIHHSIADGRSMEVLFDAIGSGRVKETSKAFSTRKYAALESSPEMMEKYTKSLCEFKRILGDTPPKLELDFGDASVAFGDQRVSNVSSIVIDAEIASNLSTFCTASGVSMFSAALHIVHQTLRGYSHEPFALGVAHDVRPRQFRDSVGMFVNTVLVPLAGGKEGGNETVEDIHRRWTTEILPHGDTPYDMVSSMGYGCNVYLAYNVSLFEEDIEGAAGGGDGPSSNGQYHSIELEEVEDSNVSFMRSLSCILY